MTRTWTLTDHAQNLYVDHIALGPEQAGGAATGYSVTKRTLQAGLSQGVDVIEVNNGAFRFTILPTRGMGLWKASLGSVQLGWRSPVKGPVHPAFVRLDDPSGIGWLEGFGELLVRCGLESNGAPEFLPNGRLRYGLHGKIGNLPAHKVEVAIDGNSGTISVSGTVDEARLFGNKLRLETTISTRVGQPGLTVTDRVTNLSAEPSELELLYHVNFGVPLLSPGAKVVLPVKRAAPRDAAAAADLRTWDTYGPESPGVPEACFFFDLAADAAGRTQATLKSAAGDQGVSLRFNKNQLPCFTLWKNRHAACDGYVTGLEPATNYPNTKSFEKRMGRVVVLQPGESRTFEVEMEAYADAAAVRTAEAEVAKLHAGTTPQILAEPWADWSAG
jgi:galactose mutarotase-like enzyme